MALDSVAKRISAMNTTGPWRHTLPIPDGAVDQDDRQTLSLLYSGISAGEITILAPAPTQAWQWDLYRRR